MQYVLYGGSEQRADRAVDRRGGGRDGELHVRRVESADEAGATNGTWGQAFTYDGFGNLTAKTATQGSAPTLSVSFDPATNRQYGVSYDANGNRRGRGTYDVENRVIVDAVGDVRVRSRGEAGEEELRDVGGVLLLRDRGAEAGDAGVPGWWRAGGRVRRPQYNVYFGGKLVKSKGVVVVTDRLGSVRANSNGERMTYYPYGEEKTSTADGREKFGTYTRDNRGDGLCGPTILRGGDGAVQYAGSVSGRARGRAIRGVGIGTRTRVGTQLIG